MRQWLATLRKEKQLSQNELGKKVGISQNHYSSIENGHRRPSPEVAQRIAQVLNFDWRLFFPTKESST